MTTTTIEARELARQRVAEGAAFLDDKIPGWFNQIDLASLEMADECHCVLGQLGGQQVNLDRLGAERSGSDYVTMGRALGLKFGRDDEAYGFDELIQDVDADEWEKLTTYDDLHDAWVTEIDARRAA